MHWETFIVLDCFEAKEKSCLVSILFASNTPHPKITFCQMQFPLESFHFVVDMKYFYWFLI